VRSGGFTKIKFGDKLINYSEDFKLYITTKLPRPHFSPEVSVMVTLLNFRVTREGLEDQMLSIIVQMEEPAKEQQRQRNIEEYILNKEKQKRTEDVILKLLNEAEGDLLEDEVLIDTLQKSKVESKETEEKLRRQEHDREVFGAIRNFYQSVAERASLLYFVVLDLALIESTYQWSLDFYTGLFRKGIQESRAPREDRCAGIISAFQLMLYENVCRSLLEKDKQVFSFLLTIRLLQQRSEISDKEVRFLAMGCSWTNSPIPMPVVASRWLDPKAWLALCEIDSTLERFEGLIQSFS